MNELRGQFRDARGIAFGIAIVDRDIGAGDPPPFPQPALERFALNGRRLFGTTGVQHRDTRDLARLLGNNRARGSTRNADKNLSTLHRLAVRPRWRSIQ
jgi:hypothetical protein